MEIILWLQWIMYTVDCRDSTWIMDIVDYGDYVIYGYSGLCIQWIAGIMWIMCTLDHVDCVCRTTECFSFHPLFVNYVNIAIWLL